MKVYKITYWVTTGFIVLIMLFTSYAYLSKAPQVMDEIRKAAFPYYMMQFLGVVKILGVIGLLFGKPSIIKEWVYAGFTFLLLGAIWLHVSTSTAPTMAILSLIGLVISYLFWKKLHNGR